MQVTIAALGLAAAAGVMAVPVNEARQEGGSLAGSATVTGLPSVSGTLSGFIPSSGAGDPTGCIGGAIDGQGVTICARAAEATPAVEARQEGGSLAGSATVSGLPSVSGTLSGFVPTSGIPYGCIGGAIDGHGVTLCARYVEPTPAVEARQAGAGGNFGGFVGTALSGGATGTAGTDPLSASGVIGGIDGTLGSTISGAASEATAVIARQVGAGGNLGGFVGSSLSGGATGTAGTDPLTASGVIGGIDGTLGTTISGAAPTPSS